MLRYLPLLTFVISVSLSGAAFLTQGCGLACSQVGCLPSVSLEVTRPDGSALTTFTATVTVDGQRVVGSCNESLSAFDGGQCADGTLIIYNVDWSDEPSVQLELSAEDGAQFSGQVQPKYTVDKNFNGPGCGECGGGSASVTVDR